MTRLFLPFCLVLVLVWGIPAGALPTQGVEAGPSANLPAPHLQWRAFAPPNGRFSVLLPGLPVSRLVAVSTSRAAHLFVCMGGENRYLVEYDDPPVERFRILGAEKILTFAVDAFLKYHPSAMAHKQSLTVAAGLAEEVIVALPRHKQETFRAYLVGSRIYEIRAIGPVADAEAEADREKFLNSFTLNSLKPLERNPKTP